jgi:hypothetical protein
MTKHHLTLGPNFIGKTKLLDDYIVRRDLRPIGRIRRADQDSSSDTAWEWGINLPMATPWWCIGRAASLEDAKAAFLEAWRPLYDSFSLAQIAHWHQQQDAAIERIIRLREGPQSASAAQVQSNDSNSKVLNSKTQNPNA